MGMETIQFRVQASQACSIYQYKKWKITTVIMLCLLDRASSYYRNMITLPYDNRTHPGHIIITHHTHQQTHKQTLNNKQDANA